MVVVVVVVLSAWTESSRPADGYFFPCDVNGLGFILLKTSAARPADWLPHRDGAMCAWLAGVVWWKRNTITV